jgi:hypothetical protein
VAHRGCYPVDFQAFKADRATLLAGRETPAVSAYPSTRQTYTHQFHLTAFAALTLTLTLINFKTEGFVQKILASLDILCKQYSRAGKTVIAVVVLEYGVLGLECFCMLKINLFAGL